MTSGQPDNDGSRSSLAAAARAYQAGQLPETVRLCRNILANAPAQAEALQLMGMASYQLGQKVEGVRFLSQAAEVQPAVLAHHTNLGFALLDMGRFEAAAASYRRAVELDPGNADARGNLGFALQRMGRLDEALAEYRALLEGSPSHAGALVSIGTVFREQDRLAEAKQAFEEALAQAPHMPAAMSNLAGVLQELGELDAAVELYEQTVERYPDYADALTNFGHALKELGRLDEARVRYRQAVEADPSSADAHYNLAAMLQAEGLLDAAIEHFEAALTGDPFYLRAYWGLQECFLLKGLAEQTLASCDACQEHFPDNQMTIANRAFAHLLQGDEATFDRLYDLKFFPYSVPIQPPQDFADTAAFNRRLVDDILSHPSLKWQHDDYDTSDRAFAYGILEQPTPAIAAFERQLRRAIDAFIAGIRVDPDHPFFGHVPGDYDFKMWATVLKSGGWHRPHNHEDAWLSGVYYAQAPDAAEQDDDKGGWITFDGFTRYGGNVAYRQKVREVRPEEGLLLFFPSYFLHSTNPFTGGKPRVSIAFDLQPRI